MRTLKRVIIWTWRAVSRPALFFDPYRTEEKDQ